MTLGPFYTGQIPGNPLVVTVRDQKTDEPKSLESYTSAEIRLIDPNGVSVSTTANGGGASIFNPTEGTVRYNWPSVSLFQTEGDYELQVKLISTNVADYTLTTTFEVRTAL